MYDSIKVLKGTEIDTESFAEALVKCGYKRLKGISREGDFSVKGEAILVFPAMFDYPVRIELDGNIVSRIASIDIYTYKTIEEHSSIIIVSSHMKRSTGRKAWKDKDPIDIFVDLKPGDYAVHVDYGIGRYIGNRRITTKNGKEECMALEFKDGDVLYVGLKDLDKVQKYIYFNNKKPELYKLGGKKWDRIKKRVEKGVFKVANDILDIQAKRQSMQGYRFSADTEWQKKVEGLFPYKDTEDQKKAASDVKNDMENSKPMDRLLCGDVGYGKTEVALRAAFKAVMDNKQAAILVPTTILAEQHFNTFTNRLNTFPVTVEMLSRFRSRREQDLIIKDLKEGRVDIIIGTHRLLSKDIGFKDLGLVIIDEEQRFGVRHKEKLKKMRLVVDVLTLSATPIPRTLYLALMGGRDISIINTPPLEREPIETKVIEYDERMIRDALKFELDRKGQVFFVHNRIDNIDKIASRIKKLVPEARLTIAHGRMSEHELEISMMKFIKGETDILVSTTIIESGIDIPNANTLIVNRAERFGLAELYQLRGRVGRFNRKAFAYFIVSSQKTLTGDEQARLEAIRKFTELGSGFKIAMQDLEIRGAGNILGTEQSGYIEAVGFDLYCRLLRNTIDSLANSGTL